LNRTRKLLALGAVALAAPALIAGCGDDDSGDEDPSEILRTALTQESEFDSGVLNIALDGSVEGATGGSIEAEVTGPFQSGAEGEPPEVQLDATADVAVQGVPEVPAGLSLNFEGGFALTDDSLFVTSQGTTYEASPQLYNQISPLLETASDPREATEEDPESADALIEGLSNLENEGTEEVDGEELTHLAGDLDFAALAEQSGAPVPPQVTAAFENITASLDFFVADDDTFRRVDIAFGLDEISAIAGAEAAGVEAVNFTLSVGISDVGSEQTIEAPTGAEPLDELLRQFDTSEAEILEALQGGLAPGLGGLGVEPEEFEIEPGEDPGLGDPGGAAADPQVQECIAQAENPDQIIECLNQ
jgi:hypothetical protein